MNEHDGNGEATGALGDEDPTVVLVSEDFVVGAVRRLGLSLQRAGLNCDGVADLISSGAGAAALDDADADLEDIERMIGGARRAIARVQKVLKNGHAKETR